VYYLSKALDAMLVASTALLVDAEIVIRFVGIIVCYVFG